MILGGVVATIFSVLSLISPGIFEAIELKSYDWRFILRGSRSGLDQIIFLDIDDSTLDLLGEFPIKRWHYARALQHLREAKLVVLDIFFVERDRAGLKAEAQAVISSSEEVKLENLIIPPGDGVLADSAKRCRAVLFPIMLPAVYPGEEGLTKAMAKREPILQKLEDLLLADLELYSRWEVSPYETRPSLAERLGIPVRKIDAYTIHQLKWRLYRILRSMVESLVARYGEEDMESCYRKFINGELGDSEKIRSEIKFGGKPISAEVLEAFCQSEWMRLFVENLVEASRGRSKSEVLVQALEYLDCSSPGELSPEEEMMLRGLMARLDALPFLPPLMLDITKPRKWKLEFGEGEVKASKLVVFPEPSKELEFEVSGNEGDVCIELSQKPGRLLRSSSSGWLVGKTGTRMEIAREEPFGAVRITVKRKEWLQKLTASFQVKPPVLELSAVSRRLAFAQVVPDEDGVLRSYPMLMAVVEPRYPKGFKYRVYPSVGLCALSVLRNVPLEKIKFEGRYLSVGDTRVPVDERCRMLINWRGGWMKSFKHYSFGKLLESPDEIRPFLKDRVVLIGLTATGTHDLKPTPFEPAYPYVGSHANVINTLLTGEFIRKPSKLYDVVVVWAVVLVISAAAGWLSRAWTILTSAGVLVAYLLICYASFLSGVWLQSVYAATGGVAALVIVLFYRYTAEERQKRFIRNAFQRYLAPELVEELARHPEKLRLGGERKEITILFSDLQGFSSISEKNEPEVVVNLLNEYLSEMSDIIIEEGGLLDKYEGDLIMAEFGAPVEEPDHALRACVAALRYQEALADFNATIKHRGFELTARIGINSGVVLVGNMGSRHRFDYTAIGNDVDLASRLEGANKFFGTRIMISERTRELAGDSIVTRELDLIRVAGKEKPIRVFELVGLEGKTPHAEEQFARKFSEGVRLYRERAWGEALSIFKACLEERPDDVPSRIYVERCVELARNPPPGDWDGVTEVTKK